MIDYQLSERILAPLALVSNLALVIFVTAKKEYHKTMNWLQVFLGITDCFTSLFWAIGSDIKVDLTACDIAGTVFHFFLVANTCWSFVLPVHCYLTIMKGADHTNSYVKWYHVYAWGVSLVSTIALFAMEAIFNRGDVIGDATFECWISSAYPDLRIANFYVILWVHMVLTIGIYLVMIYFIVALMDEPLFSSNTPKLKVGSAPTSSAMESTPSTKDELQNRQAREAKRADECNNSSSNLDSKLQSPQSPGAKPTSARKELLRGSIKRLLIRASLVSFGFFFAWLPPSIVRILGLVGIPTPHWLLMWDAISLSSSGLFNAAVFFINIYWTVSHY